MEQSDILLKLQDKNYLPSVEELKVAFPLSDCYPTDSKEFPWLNPAFTQFQHENHNYQVYTVEFIKSLASYLLERINRYRKPTADFTILEVGAGDGRLTKFLKEHLASEKINVIATDSKDWETKSLTNASVDVEKIDYLEALAKYQPQIVISCWMNVNVNWTLDFMRTNSVEEYIMIGDVFRTAKYGQGWYLPNGSNFTCSKLTRDIDGSRNGIIQGSVGRFDGSPFNPESRTEVYSFTRNNK